jgi:hypothetical protein
MSFALQTVRDQIADAEIAFHQQKRCLICFRVRPPDDLIPDTANI